MIIIHKWGVVTVRKEEETTRPQKESPGGGGGVHDVVLQEHPLNRTYLRKGEKNKTEKEGGAEDGRVG